MFFRSKLLEATPKRMEVVFPTFAKTLKFALLFSLGVVGFFPLTIAAIFLGQHFPGLPMPVLYFGLVGGVPWLLAELLTWPLRRRNGGKFRLVPGRLTVASGWLIPWQKEMEVHPGSRLRVNDRGIDDTRYVLELWRLDNRVVLLEESDLPENELRWLRDRGNQWLQEWEKDPQSSTNTAQLQENWPRFPASDEIF